MRQATQPAPELFSTRLSQSPHGANYLRTCAYLNGALFVQFRPEMVWCIRTFAMDILELLYSYLNKFCLSILSQVESSIAHHVTSCQEIDSVSKWNKTKSRATHFLDNNNGNWCRYVFLKNSNGRFLRLLRVSVTLHVQSFNNTSYVGTRPDEMNAVVLFKLY